MSLKAGIAKVNITPPVGIPQAGFAARADVSQGVLDDLFAKALVLDDGKLKIAIVTCDLLGLDKDVVAEIRRLIEKRTDISKNNIMIACSHTHSGPAIKDPGYLEERIIANFLPQWIELLPYKIAGKRRSPFEQTFVIGYANDINVSYVPTSESYEEGGYEPDWAKVDQGADKIIEDEAVALLKSLKY